MMGLGLLAATQPLFESGGGGGAPANSIVHFDFMNQRAFLNGSEVEFSDLVDGFIITDLTADGFWGRDASTSSRMKAIGGFFSAISDALVSDGFTMFLELTANTGTGYPFYFPGGEVMYILSSPDPDTADTIYLDMYSYFGLLVGDYNDLTEIGNSTGGVLGGIQRMAATLFQNEGGGVWRTSTSTNGKTPEDTTTSHAGNWFSVNTIEFLAVEDWNSGIDRCFVRSATLYPAMNKNQIQALTVVNDWPAVASNGVDSNQFDQGNAGFGTTTNQFTFPDHDVGDLLLAFLAADGEVTFTITVGTGWTIGEQKAAGVTGIWLWKYATGTDPTDDPLTVTSSASTRSSYTTQRFKNVITLETAAGNSGTGADAQSPSVTPSGGLGKYAYMSVICFDANSAYIGPPAEAQGILNYIGASNSASVLTYLRWAETDEITPQAWNTNAEEWVGFTIVMVAALEWSLNFVTETYTKNGSSISVGDIISLEGSSSIGTGGLNIAEDEEGGSPLMIGELLRSIVSLEWTIVIEFEVVDTDFAIAPLWITEPVDGHSFTVIVQWGGTAKLYISEGGFFTRDINFLGSLALGVHKIAITRTDASLRASLNGGSVQYGDDVPVNVPDDQNRPNQAAFGGDPNDFSYNNMKVRTFDLFNKIKADDELPGLSS